MYLGHWPLLTNRASHFRTPVLYRNECTSSRMTSFLTKFQGELHRLSSFISETVRDRPMVTTYGSLYEVMVWLKPLALGQDQKNRPCSWSCRSGVLLWNMVLLCARRHNDLRRTQQLFKYYYLCCAWNITIVTTVEINSGAYLLKS